MPNYMLEFVNGAIFVLKDYAPLDMEELGRSHWLTYRIPNGTKFHFNIAQIQCIREVDE